ncbi:STAS-like domain-containing protein [Fusobacterium animalis]|uniref:STAS-like domain-containing protein n=1 Tax=Fusobacterium animalis TaxID=76859 RepID=UPI0030D62D6B
MSLKREEKDKIKEFLLKTISIGENPYKAMENNFKISRQTVSKYLNELVEKNYITKNSKGNYTINFYISESKIYKNKNLEEDIVYDELIKKYEIDKKNNVKHILVYAFTEMLNNAIEHSEGTEISIYYAENYFNIFVTIKDNGIGIFRKIVRDHNLKNENEAIFELKKGKLTSDVENHSGEGIFFTSKVVDYFLISSFNKTFSSGSNEYFYNIEKNKEKCIKGTEVILILNKNTERTTKEIFDEYTSDDFVFNKTKITVHLAKDYLGHDFVSRSLAKRILMNVEKFKIIVLDFENIDNIGQGFADEVFRVFKNKNPDITIVPVNMNEEIEFMINRAMKNNLK